MRLSTFERMYVERLPEFCFQVRPLKFRRESLRSSFTLCASHLIEIESQQNKLYVATALLSLS